MMRISVPFQALSNAEAAQHLPADIFSEGILTVYETLDRRSLVDFAELCEPLGGVTDRPVRLALIGGFLPRRCGIATFTADIFASLKVAAPDLVVDVYAMAPATLPTIFDPSVCGSIAEGDLDSFVDTALRIEASHADVVWLQHEFGLFGGVAGDLILELVDRVAAPLIITLHTVLAEPDDDQRRVMERLISRASKLVVMTERSGSLLRDIYGVDRDQIVVIAHGAPDRPFGRSEQFKSKFGFGGRKVVLTFGLISAGKGIEAVIEALPAIVKTHPDILYCVAGATHPNVLAQDGEAYRDQLKALAVSLGVEANICWIDAFLETEELLDLIEAADVYATPYTGAEQSTSGTLAYAIALGKGVISTPYEHAVELLANDHGVLVPFSDSTAMAGAISDLFADPDRLLALQKRAYACGRAMIWPAFATRSHELIEQSRIRPTQPVLPKRIGIEGLLRICDDTGIMQHSILSVPNRAHGYCVDDNARALMLMNRLNGEALGRCGRLTFVFAAFVQNAWNEDRGEFRNFMGFERDWLEAVGSEDSCGRTLWALGATAREGRTADLREWAGRLFAHTASSARGFNSPRAIAFAMLGADYRLAIEGSDDMARNILEQGVERLLALRATAARPDWDWFEPVLAYDNCRLPEAMLRAGKRLGREDVIECGLDTLRWITQVQIAPEGHFRPVGSDSFGHAYTLPHPFDQQPVEIWAAVDAASAAYDVTSAPIWLADARRAFDWFAGRNDRGVAVADPATGTSRDGINPRGLNLNEGAESVLAYQLAHHAIRHFIAKVG